MTTSVLALGNPIPEAESTSTEQTGWGWWYNQTVAQINAAKSNGSRPINLIPNGLVEAEPRYHVLYVKNDGAYRVDDWLVVARTPENVAQLSTPAFRSSGWRITNIALHEAKSGNLTVKRAGTIAVRDVNLYAEYDVRGFMTYNELMQLAGDDNRVVDLDTFQSGGTTFYSAVFVPNSGANYKKWAWLFNSTRSAILNVAKNLNGTKYRVSDFERLGNGNYNAIMVESKGEVEKWYVNQTDATLKNDVLTRHGSWNGDGNIYGGARFFDMVTYKEGNTTKFEVLTMENGIGNYPMDKDNVSVLEPIDEVFLKTMSRHGIPGGNFALAKNGKVIYRAAFGYADLASKTPATRTSRGRIASITKPITAAAIMKLVENGTIDLDDQVFGDEGILKNIKPFDYAGYAGNTVPNLKQIKVRHLLNHSGGWERGRSGDPSIPDDGNNLTCDGSMECEPTMYILGKILNHAKKQGTVSQDATQMQNIDDIIRYMISPDDKDYLPVNAPGTKSSYSNFGYTVLQRIIEVKTNKTYEQFIGEMESAMGVNFLPGRSKPENKQPNEWTYHDEPGSNGTTSVAWSSTALSTPVPKAYYSDMKMLHGHGGWVTTPADLVKFASKLDGTAGNPWISYNTFRSMVSRQTHNETDDFEYYALGWNVDNMDNWRDDNFVFEHGGALSGAGSLTLKGWSYRKMSMAFLFNSRVDEAGSEIKNGVQPFLAAKDDDGTLTDLAN